MRLRPSVELCTISYIPLLVIVLLTISPIAAQWQPDVRLTNDPALSATSYNNAWCVAAGGDTIHVVWYDNRIATANWEIYYKRSSNGGTSWGIDTRITADDTTSNWPTVAASGADVHVAWIDYRDLNPEVYYKRSTDAGLTWGTDLRLTNDTSYSSNPSLAVQGSSLHAVWEDSRGGDADIYYKRSTDRGATWTPDVRLTADPAASGLPSVAVSGANIHAVWQDSRLGGMLIYYKRSTDNGTTWEADTLLSTTAGTSMFPCVAAAGSDIHVVWGNQQGVDVEIYYKRSTDNGVNWDPDFRMTNAAGHSFYSSIAASGPLVHVVWRDARGGPRIYYKKSADRGANWSTDTALPSSSAIQLYPSVAAGGSKVHVVWWDQRDGPSGNVEIYYKRNPTGNVVRIEEEDQRSNGTDQKYRITPNPFRNRCDIRFTMRDTRSQAKSHEPYARLQIFDVSGRVVRSFPITNNQLPITIRWSGRDDQGAAVPPGVYFCRVESGEQVETVKIVKLE